MFMTVHYAIRLNGPRLDSFPALADWYRRIGERPSAARVVQKIAEADRTVSWPLSARGPVSQSEHYRATPGNRAFDPEWNSRLDSTLRDEGDFPRRFAIGADNARRRSGFEINLPNNLP